MSTDQEWAELRGSLPEHGTEIMTAHAGAPSVQEQARTHGAGIPPVDNGQSDAVKYGSLPSAR